MGHFSLGHVLTCSNVKLPFGDITRHRPGYIRLKKRMSYLHTHLLCGLFSLAQMAVATNICRTKWSHPHCHGTQCEELSEDKLMSSGPDSN